MRVMTRARVIGFGVVIGAAALSSCASDGGRTGGAKAKPLYLDLTLPIPTFESLAKGQESQTSAGRMGTARPSPAFLGRRCWILA
jgi:hypothetical protein